MRALLSAIYCFRQSGPNPLESKLAAGEVSLNPYIKIAGNGQITIITPRAEMGQGAQTGLAQLVAEELDVPLDAVAWNTGRRPRPISIGSCCR